MTELIYAGSSSAVVLPSIVLADGEPLRAFAGVAVDVPDEHVEQLVAQGWLVPKRKSKSAVSDKEE